MVHIAAEAASKLSENGIDVEIVDLRTLLPFDAESCIASVQKTGRLVVLQEGQWHGGLGHTIQSRILESTFYQLETQPSSSERSIHQYRSPSIGKPHHSFGGTRDQCHSEVDAIIRSTATARSAPIV